MGTPIEAIEQRLTELPKGLFDHISRTRNLARIIAEAHGVDQELCDIGAAAHDLARHHDDAFLIREAESLGLRITNLDIAEPLLLHGPVAARWIRDCHPCLDEDVISSVHYHTTGRPQMSKIEKVVFLADKLEPQKVINDPSLAKITKIYLHDLDEAVLSSIALRIRAILKLGGVVHPLALDTWNWILLTKSRSL